MGDCTTVRPVLPELALGALGGDERADALRHVASCGACARELERLADVADGLLALAAPAEPPAGFESVVLARMTGAPRRPPRRRRVLALAAGAVAVALAGATAGAAVVHRAGGDDRLLADQYRRVLATADGQHLRALALTTAAGDPSAGTVFLYQGRPSWMLVAIADAPVDGAYRTVVTYAGGASRDAGFCQVTDGTGTTAYPLRAPVAEVAAVTLTAPDGTTLHAS
ncbi:zf-HC2 domain-containing protein [Asanoa iriomotensis]|uniref:Putative zinc-finger domain-containing protein n=1 Tax=Asanoa iriomotensis TaxID=234613 RepID=A0ABQ4BTR5_9ACTN|nr:zf-HC2 domain-containing protein [Asanoa iriomotensis]GIF53910.1 hypothetical protein Air01nite_00050 [Asanoa iriomotensis]